MVLTKTLQGVGVIKDSGEYLSRSAPNINVTDNNGLEEVVENLEQLYTDPNYPTRAPVLSQSLRDSGKSRADLWAFASMVGVEYGIQINNIACNDPGHITQDPRVRKPTCVHDPMIEECYVKPPRPFKFHFGRADCTEFNETVPYITTKEENHPSPLYNGRKTIDFFKVDFNFTGRETAAIFGAHSFGNPHWWISLIPYTWTSRGINLFNNDYYKSLTGQDRWFFNDDTCNAVGDAYRKRPKTRWMAHAKMATQRGGPIFWIHENLVCPNKAVYETLSDYDKACLDEAETGMDCKADPRSSNGTDLNYNDGCERYRLISGADEIAMTCEMGLYREFEMDDGIIHGCPGLEHFNESMSAPVVHDVVWSHLPEVGRAEPLCPKQRLAEPPGDTPLYQIMEEYASNQTTWISDYITTHEKMVQNGYAAGSLTLAPDHFTNVHCPAPVMVGDWQPTYCYEIGPVTGQPFRIKSRMIENMDKVASINIFCKSLFKLNIINTFIFKSLYTIRCISLYNLSSLKLGSCSKRFRPLHGTGFGLL